MHSRNVMKLLTLWCEYHASITTCNEKKKCMTIMSYTSRCYDKNIADE